MGRRGDSGTTSSPTDPRGSRVVTGRPTVPRTERVTTQERCFVTGYIPYRESFLDGPPSRFKSLLWDAFLPPRQSRPRTTSVTKSTYGFSDS